MGFKLSDIKVGSKITLYVSKDDKSARFVAVIKKHVKADCALVDVEYEAGRRLSFDNLKVDIEYIQDSDAPIVWNSIRIVPYKGSTYVVQTAADGAKSNRRDSYRVPVGKAGRLTVSGSGSKQIGVRDISLSGFCVVDKQNDIKISIGDTASLSFEDLGHSIALGGRLKRMEKAGGMTVLGFEINTLCPELTVYMAKKQASGGQRKK